MLFSNQGKFCNLSYENVEPGCAMRIKPDFQSVFSLALNNAGIGSLLI